MCLGRKSGRRRVRLGPAVALGCVLISLAAFVTAAAAYGFHRVESKVPRTSEPTIGLVPSATVVARVDGTDIPMRELQLFLGQDRAAVIADSPDAARGASYWTTLSGSTTPAQRLVASALSDAARAAVQFDAARRYGLKAPVNYEDFIAGLNAENARRAHAIATGQPIYGPRQYSEAAYLDYVLGQTAFDLAAKMVADGTLPTDSAAGGGASQPSTDYEAKIDRLVASATITTTDATQIIVNGGCLSTGECEQVQSSK